jgi:hypothetical protein
VEVKTPDARHEALPFSRDVPWAEYTIRQTDAASGTGRFSRSSLELTPRPCVQSRARRHGNAGRDGESHSLRQLQITDANSFILMSCTLP